MVRCAEFYEKWKRDPNWCEKSPKAVEQIDHYLALVDEVTEHGADPIAIYKNLPEGVGREVYKLKGDSREMVIVNAAGKIKRGEKVSTSDINAWLGVEQKLTSVSDDKKRTIVPEPQTPPPLAQEREVGVFVTPFVRASELSKQEPVPGIVAASLATEQKPDPSKETKERMEELAKELVSLYSPQTQQIVREVMEYHNSYKTKDVIYYAIQMYGENRKKW